MIILFFEYKEKLIRKEVQLFASSDSFHTSFLPAHQAVYTVGYKTYNAPVQYSVV